VAIETGKTPQELGFRMPAEWDKHEGTWLGWPQNRADWPGKFAAIPWVYSEIVRQLSMRENVHVLVNSEAVAGRARSALSRSGSNLANVSFHIWPTDRVWLRDSGPIFVKDAQGKLAITDWKFNAWAKYDDWKLDDQVPAHVAKLLKLPRWQPTLTLANGKQHRLVLEGGSIDVNGQGTLITTEECLLSEVQQRNPGVSRAELERAFHGYLGIDQVIWLDRGTAGDDTHGHVDDITRFVAPETIVTAVEADPADDNHAPLAENLARLKASRTTSGKQWTIIELPMPRPVVFRGQRLPASYANFYIGNGMVLVPTFNDPNDRVALGILAECFPDREVVGIHAVDLVWGLGTLHCMTQQQPAAG
jgi:agmatine deiminase